MAHEKAVVGGNNRVVAALNAQGYNTTTSLLPNLRRADQRAIKAMTAACPGSVRMLVPA
jgi:hypothetical protein